MKTSWRPAVLERGKPIRRFFDTLESTHSDERFAVQRCVKAHERRLRGNMKPRPMGRAPRRGERYERIGRRVPGNTAPLGTDSPDAQTLEVAGWQRIYPGGVQASL
jgi:hypothetical protein